MEDMKDFKTRLTTSRYIFIKRNTAPMWRMKQREDENEEKAMELKDNLGSRVDMNRLNLE